MSRDAVVKLQATRSPGCSRRPQQKIIFSIQVNKAMPGIQGLPAPVLLLFCEKVGQDLRNEPSRWHTRSCRHHPYPSVIMLRATNTCTDLEVGCNAGDQPSETNHPSACHSYCIFTWGCRYVLLVPLYVCCVRWEICLLGCLHCSHWHHSTKHSNPAPPK